MVAYDTISHYWTLQQNINSKTSLYLITDERNKIHDFILLFDIDVPQKTLVYTFEIRWEISYVKAA